LSGVIETADVSIRTLDKIIDLQTDIDQRIIPNFNKSRLGFAQNLMKYLYSQPIVDVSDIMGMFSFSFDTSMRLINDFVKHGILYEMSGKRRNRIYGFKNYLILFQ